MNPSYSTRHDVAKTVAASTAPLLAGFVAAPAAASLTAAHGADSLEGG